MKLVSGIFFFFMSLQVNIGSLNAEMSISMSPPSGKVGTTFTNSGNGFTPNSTVTLMRKMPDGIEAAIARIKTDTTGSFTVTWAAKTPGSNFVWWVVDDTTGMRSGNEVVYSISAIESSTISQPPQPETPIAPKLPITTQGDVKRLQEITHEIQLLRREMIDGKHKLPEYLPGTSGRVDGVISGAFGSKKYDKHYYEDALRYHNTAINHLKQSSNFVKQGNAEQANNYLNLAKQSLQKFHTAESASAKAWDGQLAKAEKIAKTVQTVADHSLGSLASLVPGAPEVVKGFLLGRNFYFDTKMYGISEAGKNGIITIILGEFFKKELPNGKPVKGLGQIDLRLLAKRLREDTGFSNRVAKEVFIKLNKEIGSEIVREITNKAADGFAKYLESITPPTVTDVTPPTTQQHQLPITSPQPPTNTPPKTALDVARVKYPQRVLLSQYRPLSQLDHQNYHDTNFAKKEDTALNGKKVPVKKLACLATVYTILARAAVHEDVKIDEFYEIGVGAIRPNNVGSDQGFDLKLIIDSLQGGRPVVLHGYGGDLGQHFVLAIGFESISGSTEITALDPWGGKKISIDGGKKNHPYFNKMKFLKMRILKSAYVIPPLPKKVLPSKPDPVHRPVVIISIPTITSLTPSSIETSSAPYAPTLSFRGSGFSNVTQIIFNWTGAVSGSVIWNKGDSRWNKSVRILSDTSMNITPRVVEQSPSWSGTLKWTTTLRDTRGATASQNFTVTYRPRLTTKPTDPAHHSPTLRVNSRAVVSNTYEPGKGYVGLKLRNGPGLKTQKTGNLSEGTRVVIKSGPVSRDGYTWWHVKSQDGQEGWCAGNWLVPVP